MVQIAGYSGQVDWGVIVDSDVEYNTHAWTLDVVGETAEVTDFTSAGWREYLATLKSWSGSIECYVDATIRLVPSDVGSTAALRLYLNSTQVLWGQAICSGWHPAVAVDGVETQTLDFQGTSDLFIT